MAPGLVAAMVFTPCDGTVLTWLGHAGTQSKYQRISQGITVSHHLFGGLLQIMMKFTVVCCDQSLRPLDGDPPGAASPGFFLWRHKNWCHL